MLFRIKKLSESQAEVEFQYIHSPTRRKGEKGEGEGECPRKAATGCDAYIKQKY